MCRQNGRAALTDSIARVTLCANLAIGQANNRCTVEGVAERDDAVNIVPRRRTRPGDGVVSDLGALGIAGNNDFR